jgi:hypothetical protein
MRIRTLILAAVLALTPAFVVAKQQKPNFRDTLSNATLAVYQGKQVCKYEDIEAFFGTFPEWGCKFVPKFVCTATVVGQTSPADYIGLTAGHCFDWTKKDEYYVSEKIGSRPVLRKIHLAKFENDQRYDFAVFEFSTSIGRSYPVIDIQLEGTGPEVGLSVLNNNYSFGLVKQTIEGKVVSEIITDPAVKMGNHLKGRYLVSIGLGPGASGSAVIDESTHKIVGIVEAVFPGTQMPTVVMPTGQSFANFIEDDSAGLEPEKEPKPNKGDVKQYFQKLWNLLVN